MLCFPLLILIVSFTGLSLHAHGSEHNAPSTTIFIHGTIIPVISPLMNIGNIKPGLNQFSTCTNRYKRIGATLTGAHPQQFPASSFYCFGWSGDLDFHERKKAAHALYEEVKNIPGPKTLIGHSHGCNVILYLAHIAQEKKDTSFTIDRLILMAAPVQNATSHYVSSPIFKKIISFYSTADLVQIADPQGAYTESKKVSVDRNLPFFSKRIFPDAPQLTQVRILLNRQSPAHTDFIQPRFLRMLPDILTLLADATITIRHAIIDIPFDSKPLIVNSEKFAFVPRSMKGRKRKRS